MTTQTNANGTVTETVDLKASLDWLFGARLSAEEQERLARERRVQQLLPQDEEDTSAGAYDGRLARRLVSYLGPYRVKVIWAVVFMSISSILNVMGPTLIGWAIDDGIRAGSIQQLRLYTVIFIVAALVEWITNRARIALMAYAGTRVVADMRSELFRHLDRLSLNFHNNTSVGRLDEPVDQRCRDLQDL
ncbi:MAG: ABC transporter transmembrane domain-containing protein [Caldilineaceae bacterium]